VRDIVIDTDAASLLQRNQAPPWVLRHVDGARIWLAFVTVGELAKWAVVRRWGEDRRHRLDAWTAGRPVIPYDTEIARIWGELAGPPSCGDGPGRRTTPGSAACCLRYQVPLVTLNTGDFGDFAEHHGLVLLGD
jgi:predicted nucleic acid-binding protein